MTQSTAQTTRCTRSFPLSIEIRLPGLEAAQIIDDGDATMRPAGSACPSPPSLRQDRALRAFSALLRAACDGTLPDLSSLPPQFVHEALGEERIL